MRSIESGSTFPLSDVKPLDGLTPYRSFCLDATRKALSGSRTRRQKSIVTGSMLVSAGQTEGLDYLRCPDTGSLFLAEVAPPGVWESLLKEVAELRHSPKAFHANLSASRTENVYLPKLQWIENTLRIQGLRSVQLLDVMTPPNSFSELLKQSSAFESVTSVEEMALAHRPASLKTTADAAVLLESLDRVDEPQALLQAVWERLNKGGLLFVTALVASGFDMAVLGLHNKYLYPPDRTNCFTRQGLEKLLTQTGFRLVEVSTPGVLDVEIVQSHRKQNQQLPLSAFERHILDSDEESRSQFQSFLQQRGLSSFARIVGRKE